MSINHLFSKIDFGDFADLTRNQLGARIEKLMERNFQGVKLESLAEGYFDEFSLMLPTLETTQIYQRKPVDIKIEIDSEYSGKPFQSVDGTRFEIILPYSGNNELFTVRPTLYNSDPPYGDIEKDGIHFIYEVQVFHDHQTVRTSFDQNLSNIRFWMESLSRDVNAFNNRLYTDIFSALQYRAGKVSKEPLLANLLGFPIR